MALPSARAMRSLSPRTRTLCLPSAMCGPFCSVPPIGMMTVVAPAAMRAASSGEVSASRKTEAVASASAGPDAASSKRSAQAHDRSNDMPRILRDALLRVLDQDRIEVARRRLTGEDVVEGTHAIHEHDRHAAARVAVLRALVVLGLCEQRQCLANVGPEVRIELHLLRENAGILEVAHADVERSEREPRAIRLRDARRQLVLERGD